MPMYFLPYAFLDPHAEAAYRHRVEISGRRYAWFELVMLGRRVLETPITRTPALKAAGDHGVCASVVAGRVILGRN